MQETAEDQEKEQRKERKAMMAREQVQAKILSRNSMATVESTVTRLKLVGRHVQRNQQRRACKKDKQVNVLDEQEKADLDAEKDIRELSDALCLVSFNVMPDEVQNDWN